MGIDRMWEVVQRNLNPFKGANKPKLIALDRLIQKIGFNLEASLPRLQETDWVYSKFNFQWVQSLTEAEFQEFRGMWLGSFQSHARSASSSPQEFASPNFHQLATASHRFAAIVSDAERSRMLMNENSSEFWDALQFTKLKYQKIATDRNLGRLRRAIQYIQRIGNSASDLVFQNKVFGQYAAKADLINNIYDDAAANGPQSSLENKLLVAGGLWRVIKTTLSLAFGGIVLHVSLSPMHVLKKSLGALDALAGMVMGLTDLVLGKNPSFQPLTGRLGVDAMIARYKKKYLGPGLHEEGDTLRRQMEDGPARLSKSSDITIYDLDKVRDQIKRSLWWCKVWEKDVEELRRDAATDPRQGTLMSELKGVIGDGAASDVASLDAAINAERAKQKEKLKSLEGKIEDAKAFYGKRLETINDLLASSETRLSLARTQARSAGGGHTFDIMRQIAVEASEFDRSKLKPVAPLDERPLPTAVRRSPAASRASLLEEIELTAQQRDRPLSLVSCVDTNTSLDVAA